jgi:hypothetical protein
VLLESPRRITIFKAKVWKILIFERILLLEIQTNCKNWVWKENLVELSMCSYLGANGIGYISLFMKQYFVLFCFIRPCPHRDKDYHIQSNFCNFYLIKIGFTLGEQVYLVEMFKLKQDFLMFKV